MQTGLGRLLNNQSLVKKNSIISGIITSVFTFLGGYYISRLIWKYFDGGYAHGLGLSHLFIFLLFFFCIGWFVYGIIKRKNETLGLFWIGSAIMNFCFIVASLIYLFIDIYSDTEIENETP